MPAESAGSAHLHTIPALAYRAVVWSGDARWLSFRVALNVGTVAVGVGCDESSSLLGNRCPGPKPSSNMAEQDLSDLLLDPARQTAARSRLRDEIDAAPRTLTYKHWLAHLPQAQTSTAVTVLSSFTAETLEPFLQLEGYLSGWRPQTSYVQYGQWQNALLSGQGLEHAPAAVVLLLHDTELLGPNCADASAALDHLENLLSAFRQRSATPLFLGLVQPPFVAAGLGLGEAQAKGRAWQRAEFARGVVQLSQRLADLHLLALGLSDLGAADWFDAKGFLATHSVLTHKVLPAVARCIARHVACLYRPRRKVLVLDMDNTLWGGVVGEDGVQGVALGHGYPGAAFLDFQRTALALRESGVLLAAASKNNEADVMAVFGQRPEMLLKPEHFSAMRINWSDKASNIASMAEQLGLGLDSFVFADDSAIECALVREALPQVEVVELPKDITRYSERLLRTQAFDVLKLSDEDRQRASSYAAEAGRQQLRAQVTDMASFLADCNLRLSIQAVSAHSLDRVHQLMGKTNQFNFTLARPSKEALQAVMQNTGAGGLYSATLSDRFGDYGLIGFMQMQREGEHLHISNMALSCRALGRGVEDALLAFARDQAEAANCTQLRVASVRGPRNQQVLAYLDGAGFERLMDDEQGVLFASALGSEQLAWPAHVTVEKPGEKPGAPRKEP
jgi:FkbH-like protein